METRDLVIKSRSGDMQAFSRLVTLHQPYVYQIAYRVVLSAEDARDVVQEVFVKVWRNLSKYRMNTKFTTWLYRIAVNAALDRMRQNKRHASVIAGEASGMTAASPDPDPERALLKKETRELIERAMNRLPEKRRLVFILRDLQELSVQETAEILKCSEQNVKSHLYYARRHIRETIIKSEGV
ncbi:RNA polymerase sigma factor [bacterium]|nr:RNA polymerase sigma factor [bacterium]